MYNYFVIVLEKHNEDFVILTNITPDIGKNINLNLNKYNNLYRGFIDSHFMKIYALQKYINEPLALLTTQQIMFRPNSDETLSLQDKLKSDNIKLFQDIQTFNKKLDLIINLYTKDEILQRLSTFRNDELVSLTSSEEIMTLYNNIDLNILNVSKSFSNKGQLIYFLDVNNLIDRLNHSKVYPDPHVLRFVDMKKFFNGDSLHYNQGMKINNSFKKFNYILDIYEGFLSVKNIRLNKIDNTKFVYEICNNLYNAHGANSYIYMPFTFFRYLLMNGYLLEVLIDEIYVSTKIYPNFRNEYDYIDFNNYSKYLKVYSQFYVLMYFLEFLKTVNIKDFTNCNITKISFKDNLIYLEDLNTIQTKTSFVDKCDYYKLNEVKLIEESPF